MRRKLPKSYRRARWHALRLYCYAIRASARNQNRGGTATVANIMYGPPEPYEFPFDDRLARPEDPR